MLNKDRDGFPSVAQAKEAGVNVLVYGPFTDPEAEYEVETSMVAK